MSNLNIDTELSKLSTKQQYNELGMMRYRMDRGDAKPASMQ